MFWKFLKTSTEIPETATTPPHLDKQILPLEFLEKLIPLGELPLDQLRTLRGHISSFTPGQIIFTREKNADELIYLYSGHIFLEAANGSGYCVDQGTFKAYYPLSANTKHQFTAIAKSDTQIAYLPLSALQNYSKNPLVNNPLIIE